MLDDVEDVSRGHAVELEIRDVGAGDLHVLVRVGLARCARLDGVVAEGDAREREGSVGAGGSPTDGCAGGAVQHDGRAGERIEELVANDAADDDVDGRVR